jgi:hypothetical protein
MMCEKLLSWLSLHSFWYRALLVLLLAHGMMPLWSQSSGPKSNNSNAILQTWEQISEKFQNELTALRWDLQAALNDAKQSKTSLQKLTGLYENSLTRIANLETYNEQIGRRMQERDEDLAAAYDRIDGFEEHFLRSLIVIIVMGALITSAIVFKALRFFRIIPV